MLVRSLTVARFQSFPPHCRNQAMRYRLFLSEEVREQLRTLPPEIRRDIGQRIDRLQTDLTGDVKKLSARDGKDRLRVGSFRGLFELQVDTIFIYAVKDRKEAYDQTLRTRELMARCPRPAPRGDSAPCSRGSPGESS